jgi:hypothetical protein
VLDVLPVVAELDELSQPDADVDVNDTVNSEVAVVPVVPAKIVITADGALT